MSYVVRDKRSNLYIAKKYKPNTKEFNEARVYRRISDIKNSIKVPADYNWDDYFEIITCKLVPEQRYYLVKLKTKFGFVIRANGTHFKPKIFTKQAEAEEYLSEACKDCNLHRDYFEIISTTEPPTPVRPSWQDYFLGLALVISKRSHDIHTQHGCILVDELTHHILATGYNGFPRGMNDSSLPTNRPNKDNPDAPHKYDWMIHSEVNACNNMTVAANENTVAYVTGECCTPCLLHMWQRGITKVVQRNSYGSKHLIDERTRKNREILLAQTGMKVYTVDPDLSWLSEAISVK
jgi:dCMP deaminase